MLHITGFVCTSHHESQAKRVIHRRDLFIIFLLFFLIFFFFFSGFSCFLLCFSLFFFSLFFFFICSVISLVCLFFPPNTIQGPLHSMSQCGGERIAGQKHGWRHGVAHKKTNMFLKTDSHGTGSMNSAQSKEPMEHAHRVLCVGRIGI